MLARGVTDHGFATYPRRFDGYRWYKPLLVGVLFVAFALPCMFAVEPLTKLIFGIDASSSGYDDMDFYSTAGAFSTTLEATIIIPCLLFAALIVRDRPISSYYSSMGGWRWGVFLKTFAVGLVIVAVPIVISCLMKGNTGGVSFTVGGFIILTLLGPLQGFAEELTFRGYIMQTVASWSRLPVAGVIVQIVAFAAVHPYNLIGVINIAVSGLMYALICLRAKGLEAGTALHIINNMTTIYMAGFGFGAIVSEQTAFDLVFDNSIKIVFFLFVLFAAKKFRWFDEVKRDDVAEFNEKRKRRG